MRQDIPHVWCLVIMSQPLQVQVCSGELVIISLVYNFERDYAPGDHSPSWQ